MAQRQSMKDIGSFVAGVSFVAFIATPYIFSDQADKIVDRIVRAGVPEQTITLNEKYVPIDSALRKLSERYVPKRVEASQHVNVQDLNGDGEKDYVIISYDENTPLGRVDAFRSRVDKKTGEVVYELTR